MSDTNLQPMTEEALRDLLEAAGARVMSRSGRNEHYGAPREFSFEVKAIFANNLGLHLQARQFTYRDPWETEGRVNDLIDVSLLRDGSYSELPKGYPFFQESDMEEEVDMERLEEIIACVKEVNPKIYTLQQLTGDL
ncbi:MAG: hypothetical protein RQ754_14385 [Desulfuromonadales bacterium]|jgi:hypothetical protein|nr:hypothetical protein [Desulfuromonadales bacterium]